MTAAERTRRRGRPRDASIDAREIERQIPGQLSLDDIRAACRVSEYLARGVDPTRELAESSRELVLLTHAVQAALHPRYRLRLRLRRLQELREEGGVREAVARRIGSAFAAARGRFDRRR